MMTCEEIVSRAAFFKMPAVALTDRWTTYGHHEFYHLALASGIKPVLGAEIQHTSLTGSDGLFHLTLLARDNVGYSNLTSLVSKHYEKKDGRYVTQEELVLHREGLIALTGCMLGEANQSVLHGNLGREKAAVEKLVKIYGGNNIYLEIMNHNMEKELFVLDKMMLLSKRMNLPMVVTNNDRYLDRDQQQYYSLLGKMNGEDDPKDSDEGISEYYLKKRQDLEPYFYVVEKAIDESGKIAERCDVDLDSSARIDFSGGLDADQSIAEKCERRFLLKFHNENEKKKAGCRIALRQELDCASREGMAGFLLFLSSLMDSCRKSGISLELMGSEVLESCVANILGIVPLDPSEHGLVFESFNSARPGIPPQVELYKPYGTRERFLLILRSFLPGHAITYQVVREETSLMSIAGRLSTLEGLDADLKDELINLLSIEKRNDSLHWLLDNSDRIKTLYNGNSVIRKIIHASFALQGRVHNFNLNSSKIVVFPREADRLVSFMTGPSGDRFALLDSGEIEQVGGWVMIVQKLHFLTAIEMCVRAMNGKNARSAIEEGKREIEKLWREGSLDDERTFELISEGDTTGVYLLESPGIRDLLKKIRPADFNELVNVISLYRPGPLEGRLWQKYLENSDNGEQILLPHRMFSEILKDTRGVLLYREQVREIMRMSAGLTGNEAVFVENALRKREAGVLLSARLRFIRGAIESGIEENDAQRVFDHLLRNIRFTYNRAFSCSQAYITYRTAFLKANHLDEYFTALLNSTSGVHEKQKKYFDYLESIQKIVFSPDINSSSMEFTRSGSGIRAPLNYSNTLDPSELESILADREEKGEYPTFGDFLVRMSQRLPMSSVNGLIDAGLFDFLMKNHTAMKEESLEFYEKHARAGEFFKQRPAHNRTKKERKESQLSFFDEDEND